ncbi:MAG: hypothetical protein AAB834_04040 [Patescibacteria group bacterium]
MPKYRISKLGTPICIIDDQTSLLLEPDGTVLKTTLILDNNWREPYNGTELTVLEEIFAPYL